MVIRTLHWTVPSYWIWSLPFFLFFSTRSSQFLHETPNQTFFRALLCLLSSPLVLFNFTPSPFTLINIYVKLFFGFQFGLYSFELLSQVYEQARIFPGPRPSPKKLQAHFWVQSHPQTKVQQGRGNSLRLGSPFDPLQTDQLCHNRIDQSINYSIHVYNIQLCKITYVTWVG